MVCENSNCAETLFLNPSVGQWPVRQTVGLKGGKKKEKEKKAIVTRSKKEIMWQAITDKTEINLIYLLG